MADSKRGAALGVACYLLGSLLLWDAYEHRGRARPFMTRWLPGP